MFKKMLFLVLIISSTNVFAFQKETSERMKEYAELGKELEAEERKLEKLLREETRIKDEIIRYEEQIASYERDLKMEPNFARQQAIKKHIAKLEESKRIKKDSLTRFRSENQAEIDQHVAKIITLQDRRRKIIEEEKDFSAQLSGNYERPIWAKTRSESPNEYRPEDRMIAKLIAEARTDINRQRAQAAEKSRKVDPSPERRAEQ
jgi:hypothetical protein